MTPAARNLKLRRRDVISSIHAAIAAGILIGTVSAAYFLTGLSAIASIGIGGGVGYILARAILRYFPKVPNISDAELLQIRIGRRWLFWTVVMTLFFHFVTPLSWAISFGLAAATGLLGWGMDRRKKSQVGSRLLDGEGVDTRS
jgi:hypothetical protein